MILASAEVGSAKPMYGSGLAPTPECDIVKVVRSGDNLSKIAKAHRITLQQLLDANPTFKANPNRIRVGDVLNIPNGQTVLDDQPPPVQSQPQPQPSPGRILGKLSEKFETSGRGPGTVSGGQGDPGGRSYGSYQMTSKPNGGTVKRFVSQPNFPFRNTRVAHRGSTSSVRCGRRPPPPSAMSFRAANTTLSGKLTLTRSFKRSSTTTG